MVNAPDQPQTGRFVEGEHRYPLRVYFEDTDAGGIVYHASYLRFMERARTEMLRDAGIDHAAAVRGGDGVVVVSGLAIRYRRPARLDDALHVASTIGRVGASTVAIQQRVMRDRVIVAEAEVAAVFVDPGGRPRRLPAAWRATFARLGSDRGNEAA